MNSLSSFKIREEKLLCRAYARYPLEVVRAEGSRLYDASGKAHIDLLSGIAVTSLGHCNPELAEVMAKQATKLIHVSNLFYQEEQLDLAERLLAPAHFNKAFFCNSGAEANEAAIKLARRYMSRARKRDAWEIVTLQSAFHGRTLATLSATGQARLMDGFAPLPEGFRQVPWGDLQALEAAITPRTAGVLVEIVQGEGGVRPMTAEYARGIEALCRKKDVLFMVDEVQGGLCRTGRFWSFQHFGVSPDIASCAKALANGLPMGAMLTTDTVSQGFATGSHATTFGGGAFVAAVAAKTLEIMQRDRLDERAARVGAAFADQLRAVAKKHPARIKEVRGLGLMTGVELTAPGKAVWDELLRRGFVLNLAHDTVLRLLPALTIDEADLSLFAQTLDDVLTVVK